MLNESTWVLHHFPARPLHSIQYGFFSHAAGQSTLHLWYSPCAGLFLFRLRPASFWCDQICKRKIFWSHCRAPSIGLQCFKKLLQRQMVSTSFVEFWVTTFSCVIKGIYTLNLLSKVEKVVLLSTFSSLASNLKALREPGWDKKAWIFTSICLLYNRTSCF